MSGMSSYIIDLEGPNSSEAQSTRTTKGHPMVWRKQEVRIFIQKPTVCYRVETFI
ncbi:hypothetical protein PM082_024455 [Marasmius tenuissimus]|nr:hypothetical protein PM082_024455 [Marasmius tenuissimus]